MSAPWVSAFPAIYEDDGGESAVTIRNINGPHRAIVEGIARKPTGITGRELRFVRTELGLTQAELAGVVTKDVQTLGAGNEVNFPSIRMRKP